MKGIYITIITFILPLYAAGQDILYFKDGKRDTVIIKGVTPKYISYTDYPGPEKPVYTINRDEVHLVVFQNGTVIAPEMNALRKNTFTFDGRKNNLCINLAALVYTGIHLNYERLNQKGNWGIRAHLYKTFYHNLQYRIDGAGGLDINYYPPLQTNNFRLFAGAGARLGGATDDKNNPIAFKCFVLNNGVVADTPSPLYVGLQWGAGFITDNRPHGQPYGYFSFNIGYKFR